MVRWCSGAQGVLTPRAAAAAVIRAARASSSATCARMLSAITGGRIPNMVVMPYARGLHSSTFRLIVSTFVGHAGWFHGSSVIKMAQVELRSVRV